MSKKDGMYCYYDWVKPLKKVPAEDFKQLFIAMLEYHQKGTEPPEFDGITGMAADFIFPQIERSKKYAENGAKGGLVTQSKSVGSTVAKTDGSTLKHKHIQKTKTNTKTETDTNTETNTINDSPYKPPKGADVMAERFDMFWSAYPKKIGKGAAEKAFRKIAPSKELLQTMLDAIDSQCRSEQWKRDNGQYIPNPTTWLNQKRWEDEAKIKSETPDITLDELFN